MPLEANHIPVVILAAGLSGRMGAMKPFLKWDNETTFLEKIITDYQLYGSEKIIVVVNPLVHRRILIDFKHLFENVVFVVNSEPEKGKFLSLKMGLAALGNAGYCFIQNIDNPFIDKELLDGMARLKSPDAFVVPGFEGKTGHPLLAGNHLLERIKSVEEDDQDLRILLKDFKRIHYMAAYSRVLVNINSEEDYLKVFNWMKPDLK